MGLTLCWREHSIVFRTLRGMVRGEAPLPHGRGERRTDVKATNSTVNKLLTATSGIVS